MTKKIIIIAVAVILFLAALWWLVMFFREKGLEKNLPPTVPTAVVNQNEKLPGNYNWGVAAGTNQAQYKTAVWQGITASALAGFPAAAAAVEKETEQCQGLGSEALRTEGCMCQTGYWVEVAKDGQVEKIDTAAKLKNILLPIDSAAKAVTLVALTTRDLKVSQGIPVGHTLPVSGGYLVQVVDLNTCGCSVHTPTGAIYKVTTAGVVGQIAAEIVLPSEGPEICVD